MRFNRTKDVNSCCETVVWQSFALYCYCILYQSVKRVSKVKFRPGPSGTNIFSAVAHSIMRWICHHLANTILNEDEYHRTILNALDITCKTNLNVPDTMRPRLMSNFRDVEFSEIIKEIANNSRLKFRSCLRLIISKLIIVWILSRFTLLKRRTLNNIPGISDNISSL